MKSFIVNKIVFWFPLTVIAILNGTFRTFVLNRFLTDYFAHQMSSLLLIVLIFFYTEFVYGRLAIRTSRDAWMTGLIWVALTVAFEFGLGYFVSGLSFKAMLEAYNLLAGNLWTLVLIGVATIPWLYFKFGEKKVTSAN